MVLAHIFSGRSYPSFTLDVDALALMVSVAALYVAAVKFWAPRHAPDPTRPISRFQGWMFGLGVLSLGLGEGYPIHELADQSLFSVHMAQHMIFMLLAAPLLLLGIPGWMMRAVIGHGRVYRIVRTITRPLPAFLIANITVVLLHVPPIIELQGRSQLVHAILHQEMLLAGLIMWMPVLSPLPELPRLAPLMQLLYLFFNSLLPTVPASFLTFADAPLYDRYKHVVRLWGISAAEDTQYAGLLMKLAGGTLLWAAITALFFVMAGEEDGDELGRHWNRRGVGGRPNRRGSATIPGLDDAEWDDLERRIRDEPAIARGRSGAGRSRQEEDQS